MKNLEQLVYISIGTNENNIKTGIQIAKRAQEFNSSHSITGILIVHKMFFMQCIEGDRAAINHLFQRILKDPRHKDVNLVLYNAILKRKFADWSMRAIEENLESRHHFFNYATEFLFDPQSLSGLACLSYLEDLSKTKF